MLIKIRQREWLFIVEPPRTGSTSLRFALTEALGGPPPNDPHPRRHNRWSEVWDRVQQKCQGTVHTACLARHPGIRAWSLKKWWIANHKSRNLDLEKIIEHSQQSQDSWTRHMRPCAWYSTNDEGALLPQWIIHTETLTEDLQSIGDAINIEFQKVPHHNAFLTRKPYPVINSAEWETIKQYYAADFSTFGYDPTTQPDWANPKSTLTINPYSGL